jgi:hypothetical protein
LVLAVAVCLLVVPDTGFSWTSAGPWGGVIHDLEKSAGGNTIFAGTGNGLYMHDSSPSGDWVSFENSYGYRILQVLPDPGGQSVYAIARESDDSFDFVERMWTGDLYELDLSDGSFEQIFGEDDPGTVGTDEAIQVSSMALCGGGDLLVTTFDELYVDVVDEYITGYVYRKPAGSGTFGSAIDPGWYPFNLPIQAALGQADSDTLYLSRADGSGIYSDIVRSGNCGVSWTLDETLTGLGSVTGGEMALSLGWDGSGQVLMGTGDGRIFRRASDGTWSIYGSGLPPYPVADLSSDFQGRDIAILRKHYWNLTNADDPSGGAWYLDDATWKSKSAYNYVSSKVRYVLPFGSNEWVAYDQAGIWLYPGGTGPAVQMDDNIAAADLDGIVLDPRSERVLAYGTSGVYERRDGIWNRLVMSYIGSVKSPDTPSDAMQHMRDDRYISAGFHYEDDILWLGTWDSGLVRGTLISNDPLLYRFDQLFWDYNTKKTITDIMADPFDHETFFFTNWSGDGVYRSADGGNTIVSLTGHLDANSYYGGNVLSSDLLEPAQRSILVGVDTAQTAVPGILAMDGTSTMEETSLYMNQSVGGLAFNPVDLGTKRALVGAESCTDSMAIAGSSGSWTLDSTVSSPDGLPTSQVVRSLQIPLGDDDDGYPDAFTVVHQNGTSFMGLFHSQADTLQGSPGGVWVDIGGEIDPLGPTSVNVDPKDGNLIWVSTARGSAFTLRGAHYDDNAPPFIPFKPTVTGSTTGDTLKVEPISLSADTVSTRTLLPLLKLDVKVTNTIVLEWLAPGDDGTMPGWADRYELYYNSQAIADSNDFASAWTASVPAPNVAHYPEVYSLDVASHLDSWYSIALLAYDEGNRASVMQTVSTNFAYDDGQTGLVSLVVQITGSVDKVEAVRVYRDGNDDGTFELPGDIQVGSSSAFGTTVAIPVSLSPVDGTEQTLFVVCDLGSTAESGDSVNFSVTDMIIDPQDGVSGLPAWSGTIQVVALAADTGGGSGDGGGGGGGCFIATAAYGSAMEPEVNLLRRYRDSYLVQHWWGRALLKAYYTLSPGPAAFIAERPLLRQASRIVLSPIITMARLDRGSSAPAVVGFLFLTSAGAGMGLMVLAVFGVTRRRSGGGAFSRPSFRKSRCQRDYPESIKSGFRVCARNDE